MSVSGDDPCVCTANYHKVAIFLLSAVCRHSMIVQAMNTATFHSRLGVLGLSVLRFAAMTGVQYETARHWGVVGAPTEVSTMGAADAGNDGPVGISEAARKGFATATPPISCGEPPANPAAKHPDRQRRGH